MHTPKLRLQMGACEINKGGRPNDEEESCCSSLRCWLIVWACMRLVVSVLWTMGIFLFDIVDFGDTNSDYMFLAFGVIALITQIVEVAMLVTFIVAGIKRRANLYRAYYRYCILTLVIYIIVVILCYVLTYFDGYITFAQLYITFQLSNIFMEDYIIFGVIAILNICLEVLLIHLIKKMINKYQYNEDKNATETV